MEISWIDEDRMNAADNVRVWIVEISIVQGWI